MTEVNHVISRRGRPADADSPATTKPSYGDITWAAGVFSVAPGARVERVPSTLELRIRLQRYERDRTISTSFLSFFGGQIKDVAPDGRTGEARHEWSCRGPRAIGVLLTIYSRLTSWRKAEILTELEKDAVLANVQPSGRTTTVIWNHSKETAVIVPKTDVSVPPDYDPEIMFMLLEDGDTVVYGLPDPPTLERFLADAKVARLQLLQQVELTVTLSRPA
jgi:hypothetical protein